MRSFRDLSITSKLNLSAVVAGGAALLLASAALIANDIRLIRSSKEEQLLALADMLGANSTAALTFDDPGAAKEQLSFLNKQPTIRLACIYNAKGKPFAVYHADAGDQTAPPPAAATGSVFTKDGFLDVTQAIFRDGEKPDDAERLGTVYLHSSMADLNAQLVDNAAIVTIVMLVAMGVVFIFSSRLQRTVSKPILDLAGTARAISQNRDYSTRVKRTANDELGMLYDDFNAMLDQIQRGERELQQAHDELEARVQQRTAELVQTNLQLSNEIGERERAESELDAVHQQLLDVARKAGMAEVATGVLHNVGNVLNSVNVSATLVSDRMRNSRLAELGRAVKLLGEHADELGRFLTEDEHGKHLPDFLRLVTAQLDRERVGILGELASLTKNVDHIKSIVAMQQSYAGASGLVESVSLEELVEDALRLNAASLLKYHIELVREFADIPQVRIDKQRLLQILMNLVTNAKDSLVESTVESRRLTVRIWVDEQLTPPRLFIEMQDNGVGIPRENLTRVFSHGFTTKRHGHGFGLHSSANAAKELGGAITAVSEGPGHGATFTVELPFKPVQVLT